MFLVTDLTNFDFLFYQQESASATIIANRGSNTNANNGGHHDRQRSIDETLLGNSKSPKKHHRLHSSDSINLSANHPVITSITSHTPTNGPPIPYKRIQRTNTTSNQCSTNDNNNINDKNKQSTIMLNNNCKTYLTTKLLLNQKTSSTGK